MKNKKTMWVFIFEAFCSVISSSINLLFLKSANCLILLSELLLHFFSVHTMANFFQTMFSKQMSRRNQTKFRVSPQSESETSMKMNNWIVVVAHLDPQRKGQTVFFMIFSTLHFPSSNSWPWKKAAAAAKRTFLKFWQMYITRHKVPKNGDS